MTWEELAAFIAALPEEERKREANKFIDGDCWPVRLRRVVLSDYSWLSEGDTEIENLPVGDWVIE